MSKLKVGSEYEFNGQRVELVGDMVGGFLKVAKVLEGDDEGKFLTASAEWLEPVGTQQLRKESDKRRKESPTPTLDNLDEIDELLSDEASGE